MYSCLQCQPGRPCHGLCLSFSLGWWGRSQHGLAGSSSQLCCGAEALLLIYMHQLSPQHQGDVTIPISNLINPPTSQGGEANSDVKYKDGDTGGLWLSHHHQSGVQKPRDRTLGSSLSPFPDPQFPPAILDLSHGHWAGWWRDRL